ncbi:hypothetical protein ACPB9J_33780 [Streptomyces lavendulocolor]|uniref:hypothetical protein n=1 Tax=Streptomyces lavendulocolor TaxID=67316 RepID=UPI003C2CC752
MTTQTETTTPPATQQQGTHMWVMTLDLPGRVSGTQHGTLTPPAEWTQYDAFLAIKAELCRNNPELGRANVVFFDMRPNQL